MAIAVPTTVGNTVFSGGSVTITKPTGLAVGDLMIAVISGANGVGAITTLAGWTSAITYLDGFSISVQYKIAEASDVSASNFTFTATGFSYVTGGIIRATGIAVGSEVADSEGDTKPNANTTTPSFDVSVTPLKANSLVIISLIGLNDASFGNVSGYASTPAVTYTELFDVTQNVGSVDPTMACAYGIYTGTDALTAFTATIGGTHNDHIGVMAVFTPTTDATGTNTLLSVSPVTFTQNGIGGTTGTNALLEVSPNIPTQSGKGTTPTNWSNETKPSTSWTNDTP